MSREGTAVMWKKLLVLSTTAVLVGSAAYAEQRSDGRTVSRAHLARHGWRVTLKPT